ncbi:MAG: phenylalanine--tRNA ligase subunit beta, partial [Candidatus Firestonebacteria bacterium]
ICGGIILKGMLDAYPVKQKPVSVRTRFERVRKLLGADINNSEMLDIAVRLGFKITEKDAQGFSADVPSFRVELSREIDMIEEIAQVYGYENIADRVPKAGLFASVPSTKFEDTLKNELVMRGMWEAVNWGFMPKGWFAKAGIAKESSFCDCLELLNPLTDEWNVMRPSLFPGLLGNVVRNVVSQGNRNIKLFETGNVFSGKADEHKNLGIIITGNMNEESWLNKPEDAGFFYLKGLVEGFLNGLGIILEIKQAAVEICEPGRSCEVLVNGREAGYFGEVKKNILKNFDLKQEVFFAEFSLPALLQGADFTRKFTALPKFPSIRRDTSFVVPAGLEAERITAHILSLQEPLIEKAALVFVYEGEQVGPGKKSLTYSIVFRDAGRTLTDKTVDEVNGRLVNGVINSFGVTVRK